tara:strand:+ start:3979 stop:4146 length:168 start_codon:yes stop_codon:yes gene_type:complete
MVKDNRTIKERLTALESLIGNHVLSELKLHRLLILGTLAFVLAIATGLIVKALVD